MQPRTIAGRYTVERAVGHGGMGQVWLCRDEVLGRQVAVKQVGAMPGETASDVNRALREARSSAALNHRNVVSIYDAVEEGDLNWLVMEYVPSRDLGEILRTDGPLSPERATWIGLQAADGLAAAHARGTMHRDVKPGNILVTDADHAKITDFGISRTHGDIRLTSTGLITGTPAYFSPEIARGAEPGLPADVWALGATLYAAVEGRPPYAEQGNALALLTTISTQAAPPPRQAGILTEAISRMMDRDPDARWSMDDAVHVLRRLHGRHGAGNDRQATVTLTAPAAEPVPVAAAVPSPAATGADAEGASTPIEPTPTRERPRPVSTDDARRRAAWLWPLLAIVLLAAVAGGGALLLGGGDQPSSAGAPVSDSPSAPTTKASSTPSPEPTESPEPTGTESSEEPAPTTEPAPSTEPPSPAGAPPSGSVEEFGGLYYGYLPTDTASAYALLAPSYGSTYQSYQGFWRTISAVTVRDVTAVDETTVDVALTYTTTDGGTEDETRRLFLEQTDDGYLIVDDAAV